MAAYEALLQRSTNVSNTPYVPYTGQEVAPNNQQQGFGVSGTNTVGGGFAPYAGNAGAYIDASGQPISAEDINRYMDPYTGSVINATQADFDTQNKRAQSATTGNAAAQGALGGNRVGVAQALTQEGQERVQAPIIAGLRSQGFQSAVTNANAQKQRQLQSGQVLTGDALQAAQQQYAFGTQQQQTTQAQDTQQMTDYYTQQGYPFATAQWLAAITLGTGAQMGQQTQGVGASTTQGPQPNQFAQAAGLGLSAAAAFSDKRLKENIKEIGKLHDGQKIYRYNFKGDPTTHVGMISQEVAKKHPEAVGKVAGFGTVDYDEATKDAVKRWSGGAIRGFAAGGTPYGPGTQGWVPTIGKIGGTALHDPGMQMNAPKYQSPQQPDFSKMGTNLGKIGKSAFDSFGSSGGYDWNSDPTGGYGGAGSDVTSGFADGGRIGMEDGGDPVAAGFSGSILPNYDIAPIRIPERGVPDLPDVPTTLPKSSGFEPVRPSLTGVEKPSPTDEMADVGRQVRTGQADEFPGSRIPLPRGKPDTVGGVKSTMANEFSSTGLPPVAIGGINMAVQDESNFNPKTSHWDPTTRERNVGQMDDSTFSHGLFQERGEEWNKYKNWLQKNAPDADWRDPALQTKFLAQNLRENYPYVLAQMVSARTPGEAAAIFTSGYLKPAKQHEIARVNKYLGSEGDTTDNMNPDVMQASFRPGVGGSAALSARSGVPAGQPPYIPGVAGPQGAQQRPGMGGFNPLGLSDEARQGLISMGLGMMSNRVGGRGSFLSSVGQGGEQGMTTYASARAATAAADALARKEALEKAKFEAPYTSQTVDERLRLQEMQQQHRFAEAAKVADIQERTRAHNLAMRTPVKYFTDEDGVQHFAIPRPAPDGQVDFYPIDKEGNISKSPLGGSLKEAATQNAPPELSQPAPQQGGAPKLQQAGYNPDEGIVLTNSKMESSGQNFDYSKNTPVIEKGMYVPRPAPIANHSTQSIETDAERYLQLGTLPPTRSGMSPTAIAQQKYRTTVQNYALAKAAAAGMTDKDIVEAQRSAPGMLRFILGADGRSTVALGTAVRHLDTMEDYAKEWNKGDLRSPMLNQLRAMISRQFGDSAATNLVAVGKIVGPEVIKAIGVAGAGTEKDREGISNLFTTANSEKQTMDAIKAVKKLLGGQLESKQRQASAAGVSEDKFKQLVGEKELGVLKNIDREGKGGPTKESGPPPGAIAGKRKDGSKVWKLPDGKIIPRVE